MLSVSGLIYPSRFISDLNTIACKLLCKLSTQSIIKYFYELNMNAGCLSKKMNTRSCRMASDHEFLGIMINITRFRV